MTKELIRIKATAQHCSFSDPASPGVLHNIIQELINLIQKNFDADTDSGILSEILADLKEAEGQLSRFKPETININDWKYNLQAFSTAKADILYSLSLLQGAIRFGRLFPQEDSVYHSNTPEVLERC